jgi:phospholipid/cholesterol/gamma-HCH transport system substrate-binding protein
VKLSKELKIGVVVVTAIAAFVWGLSFLKGSNLFSHKYYLYAVYPKADNLIPANPLLVKGYKIGQVSKISLINKSGEQQVLIKFLITEDVDIPVGTIAKSVSTDVLGSKGVELLFSDSKEMVKSGDTLLAENDIGMLDKVSDQIGPIKDKAENLITDIDSVVLAINSVLNKKNKQNLDMIFASLASSVKTIQQTTIKLDALVAGLAKNEPKINNIVSNLKNVSDSLAQSPFKTAVTNADKSLKELNKMLSEINKGQGTLGKLAKNDSLYNNLNKSSASLDKLLTDLRLNPHRYVHISVFGKKNKDVPVK